MNYSREQLENALRKAHAAGDTASAQKIANAIRSLAPSPGQMGMGSVADAAAQGATLGFSDELAGFAGNITNTLNRGLHGLVGWSPMDFTQGDAYEGIRDVARQNVEGFSERSPGGALAAEIAGGLVTGGTGLARTGALQGAKGLMGAAGLGATQGGLYGAGTAEDNILEEAKKGAAMGGLLGAGFPAVARIGGRLIRGRPPQSVTDDAYRGAVQRLSDDIDLSTGQKIGSEGIKQTEATLSSTPLMGTPLDDLYQTQGVQFQKKVMKMAGFSGDDVSKGLVNDDSILRAEARFSKRYANALKGKKLDLAGDDQFMRDLANITMNNAQLLPPMQKTQVGKIVTSLVDEAKKGPITGKQYQQIRSRTSKLAHGLEKTDWANSQLYRDITGALDDAFARIVPRGTSDIRRDYARFMQVKNVWEKNGGQAVAEGLIPLRSLVTASKTKGSGIRDRDWSS